MDSFFGIGPLELIFILIFALIFLGPERLPGAVRQIVSLVRQIQNLSSTLSQQLGDELGDIRELDPRYQLQQMLDEPDEKEKEAAKKAEEKKEAAAKKAEEQRKADEKKKAEAKKKAEEEKKRAEEAAKTTEPQTSDVPSGDTDSPGEDAQPSADPESSSAAVPAPAATVTQPRDDEQTSPASAPFVRQKADAKAKEEARAAANSLIPKATENSIAPPQQKTETPVNGTGDESAPPTETSAQENESAIATEEQA
ncbi:MAG: hypothetical protein KF753_08000 [Caldilineaceae bacterium]|nr:hypothetical protein [Caldilineaceae bacterium]